MRRYSVLGMICAFALIVLAVRNAGALDVQDVQALPASTSTQSQGLGVIPQFFSQVFDQWKQSQAMPTPPVSDIERGVSQKSVIIGTDGTAKLTDALIGQIGGDWFSVQVWGIAFKIQMTGKTLFSLGKISPWSFLEMETGDRVDILGTVDPQTGVIFASTVNGKIQTQPVGPSDFVTLQLKLENFLKRAQDMLASMRSASSTPTAVFEPYP